ncbi:uncharacterized protein HGUI_01485 [Hanseniaspora guilliermondii]|uniref:Zinc finger PHD-type domain-containing protein n=1 Tax=Hanseniaspora guilliermondii TaxID=56406 RepID=A0A1L0CKC0_9ASCO|nr:uncharacterized protein HGUI_01485 [Hanseniaspora guilliermondii]
MSTVTATTARTSNRINEINTPSKIENNTDGNEMYEEDESNVVGNDEGNGGDEEEEVTRCVCSLTNPPDPDNQDYIQCDKCAVWQHQACVGISPEMGEELDKYWCEICKPELHALYDLKVNRRQQGYSAQDSLKRSQYSTTPYNNLNQERRSRTPRKVNTSHDSDSDGKSNLRSSRKRSRSEKPSSARQSRNRSSAAEREEIQYQNMLQKVLQESKKDAYKEDFQSENTDDVNINKDNNEEQDTNQSDFDAVKSEDNGEATPDGEWRRSKRRRVASPRTEQKATFNKDEFIAEEESQLTPNRRQARKVNSSRSQVGSIDSVLDEASKNRKHPLNEDEEDFDEKLKRAKSTDLDETSTEQKPKRSYNRRTTQNGTNLKTNDGHKRNNNSKSKSKTTNEAEVNEDEELQQSHMEKLLKLAQEPSKPRQTPEGITVEEMFERVTAISAFLERSRDELMMLKNSQNDLLSFVENPQFIEEYKKNVDIDSLLTQMNILNGSLTKFGKL